MKKRIYRATELTKVNIEQLTEKVKVERVVSGVDDNPWNLSKQSQE